MAGALVGIGGGVVLVPALVLVFGLDFRVAVAISLVAVIATLTAAGSVYVAAGQTNMRLGTPTVLRYVLSAVLAVVAVHLVLRAVGGGLDG